MRDAGICAVSLESRIGMMSEERGRAAGSSDPGQAENVKGEILYEMEEIYA